MYPTVQPRTFLPFSLSVFKKISLKRLPAVWLTALLLTAALHAAQIRGKVVDAETGKPLADANITVQNTDIGAVTDRNGRFALETADGSVTLVIRYVGYQPLDRTVRLEAADAPLVFALQPTPVTAGEILVTGLRYEQSLKNVPMPMSVVTQARIETAAPRDVAEAVRSQSGLAVTRDGVWGSNVVIRGLSRTNIVTLVDGNRIDTANDLTAGLSMIDVNDIERIEVIKGAASSLYGSGAVGGAVNVLTRDGWYGDKVYLQGTLTGGYSSVNESGHGYLRINTGGRRWYAKLSAQTRSAGDARTPLGVLPNSRFNDENLAARIGFRPFQNHEFKLNLQRYRGTDIGIPGGSPLFTAVSDVRYPRENRDLMSLEYIGRNLTPSLARVNLKYFRQDILRDVENIPYIVRATHQTDGALLQTDWVFAGNHLIAGVDAWQKQLDSFRERVARVDVLNPQGEVVRSISQITAERPIPLSTYRSVGVFAQNELPQLFDRLTTTVGGRLDKIFVDNESAMQPLYQVVDGVRNDAPAGQFPIWTAQKVENFSWSGNLSLLYKLTDAANLTMTAARSFRAPYLEERYQYIDLGNLVKIGDPALKPEQGLFGDLGLRLYRGQSALTLNVFINRIEDMVVEAPAVYEGRSALKKTNVGSAQLYGVDAQWEFALGSRLRGFAGAAYVHGQDTYLDEPLPLIPPLNGRLGVEARLMSWLTAEAVGTFYGDQQRTASWEIETPGYAIIDAYFSTSAVAFAGLRTRLFVGVENLLDRAYRNHLSTNRGSITVEPGRNVTLRLQTAF